jgi:hypothetical protein
MASYYGFSLSSSGTANATSYYYVSATDGTTTYDSATVTLYPSGTQTTYFSFRANSLQWQAPAARVSAAINATTSASSIRGVLGASPAVNVNLTLTLYGGSGPIGSVTLNAGQSEVPFNFSVSASDALSGNGEDFMAKMGPKPEAAAE